jgi:hypothetical protein
MGYFRPAVLAVAGLLALSACASTPTAPPGKASGSTGATAATSPSVVATKPAKALTFPPVSAGEVARVTHTAANETGTIVRAPSSKLRYVVRAECSASEPGVSLKYRVSYATPPTAGGEQMANSGGEISCEDGTVLVNSAFSLLSDRVKIRFTDMSGQITSAYAVIVPEDEATVDAS